MPTTESALAVLKSVASVGLDRDPDPWPSGPLDDATWRTVLRSAAEHRVVGLLGHADDTGRLPTTMVQHKELMAARTSDLHTCLLLEEHLLEVASVLRGVEVEVRVLKGAAVAHLDYDDPSLRSFRDVDLLVRSETFDVAVSGLVRAGSTRRYQEVRPGFDRHFGKGACLVASSGLETDLHRTFAMGPFGIWIDLDDLWASSTTFELGGRQLEALSVEARLLHACYHAALGDAVPRLAQLRDVAQLLLGGNGVDVSAAQRMGAAWHGEAVIARAIALTWERLRLPDHPIAHWARDFRPARFDERALASYLDPDMGFAARSMMAVRAVPGWRAKARFVRALALPSRSYGAGRHLSRSSRWRAALADLRRLAGRGA